MLYLPWRNEQEEILNNNNEQTYITHKNIIENNHFHNDDIPIDDEFRALAIPVVDENVNILNITNGNERNGDENPDGIRVIRLPALIRSNPDLINVLLCAPTGKAAFVIGEATLHAMFSLPIYQLSGEIRPLSNDVVNSLLAKFMDLKVIIVDEISMVGAKMLGYLYATLKQIFKSRAAFGGI
ncbi:hypothetical protein CVS40_8790 [Lucilia cuprina]|nr:hypothetical protein CVS40_8790 [Lucilia cuprina]